MTEITTIRVPEGWVNRLHVVAGLESARLGRRVTSAELVRRAIEDGVFRLYPHVGGRPEDSARPPPDLPAGGPAPGDVSSGAVLSCPDGPSGR